jgi:hypothetical protein
MNINLITHITDGNVKCYSHSGNSLKTSFKTNNGITLRTYCTPEHLIQRNEN